MVRVENDHEIVASDLAVALGLAIRRLREQCGMTQEALARVAGVTQAWVSIAENAGKYNRNKNPPIEVLQRIAFAFGLSGLSVLVGVAESMIDTSETRRSVERLMGDIK